MLLHYLKSSIADIDNLIELTKKDIINIKEAKHEDVFSRTKIKNDLIKAFGNKKSLLDNELIKLVNENDNKQLEDILDDSQKDMLNSMKEKLSELKIENKEYARFVVTISEFYNSLLDSVFPRDMDGYEKKNHKPASFLEIRA
jgi:transcriptional regulator NrdR family protein